MGKKKHTTDTAATQGEASASTAAGKKTAKTRMPKGLPLPNDYVEMDKIRIWYTL